MATDNSKNSSSTKSDDTKVSTSTDKNDKDVSTSTKNTVTPKAQNSASKTVETKEPITEKATSGIDPEVYDSIEFTREQLLTSSFNDTDMLMIKMLTRSGRTYTRPQIRQLFADFKKKGLF